jgi:hypothetical protein
MTQTPDGQSADKIGQWADKVLHQLEDLLKSNEPTHRLSAAYFRIDQEELAPVLPMLASDEKYAKAAEHLRDLRQALEGYFLHPAANDVQRKERLSAVSRAGRALRDDFHPAGESKQPILETKLRDLAWRTYKDEEGHIIFDAGAGLRVPIRGDIRELAHPQIIAQAVRQQPPYPDAVRPRNLRGEPGALLQIENAKRLLVVGDLHGRYDNLELVLADKDNWDALRDGAAHLLFLGDAIHPRTAEADQDIANVDSFRVLFLILSLQAENPGRVHYLIGNHENAHIGGLGAGKGDLDVEEAFTGFIRDNFGPVVLETYEGFLKSSPVVAKVRMADGCLVALHASLTALVRNEQGLVNLTVKGRKGKPITEILWNRNFDQSVVASALAAIQAKLALSGHTNPTTSGAEKYGFTCMLDNAFAHVHGRQLIVSSQSNTLGYLDIDLTRPMPKAVEDLRAPDGKYAMRALRRGG